MLAPFINAEDCEVEIPIMDPTGRSFSVFARIDTTQAGNKVVIYAKNVLLCHTEQKLEFFYQKKTDLFEVDNENEFPLPVVDNRTEEANKEQSVVTERTKIEEPTIWIHKEKVSMCAALAR